MNYDYQIWDLALKSAANYYDNSLSKGKYPGEFNTLSKNREEAIRELATRYIDKFTGLVDREAYNDDVAKRLDALDIGALSKYAFEYGEDPFKGTRKVQLNEITGDKGKKSWYNMGPKEIEAQMYKFGYDPAIEGDRQKFLKEVADYQTARDRGDIVQQTLDDAGWVTKLGMAMNPTATQEAIRQSLTGDFNDDRMNAAVATDLIAQGGMALAPSFRAVAASPLYAGLADAGIEAARQGVNYAMGNPVDPMAPVVAGGAAATVPTSALAVGGYLSRGASTEARPLSRGFQRGLRGADDPVKAERNQLKQILINARKQSEQAAKTVPDEGVTFSYATPAQYQASQAWNDAYKKLRGLGLHSEEELKAVTNRKILANQEYENAKVLANKEYENAKVAANQEYTNALDIMDDVIDNPQAPRGSAAHQRDIDRAARDIKAVKKASDANIKAVKKASEANVEAAKEASDAADAAFNEYQANSVVRDFGQDTPYRIEQVIGRNPTNWVGGETGSPYHNISVSVEDALKQYYDQPLRVMSISNSGVADPKMVKNAGMELFRSAYPEKYAQEAGYGSNKIKYLFGQGAGRALGGVMGRVEPAIGDAPKTKTLEQKIMQFKETDWYKNLPEKKKNAVEKALKGFK